MSVTYRKLWVMIRERNIPWKKIREETGLSTKTTAKLNKNEYVHLLTLEKIANYLNCELGDIVEIQKDN